MIYENIVLRAERPMVNEAESFDEQTEIAYKFFVSMFELPEMFHPKYIPAYSKAGIKEMDWNKDNFCKLFNKEKERIKPEIGNSIFFISTCDDSINTQIWVTTGARGPLFRDYALIDFRSLDMTEYRLDEILVKFAKSYRDSYGYILVPSMFGDDRFNCHGLKKDNTLSFIHWINYFPEYLLKTIGERRIKKFARKHPGVTYKDGMLRLCDPILDLALPEHLELFNEAQELLK